MNGPSSNNAEVENYVLDARFYPCVRIVIGVTRNNSLSIKFRGFLVFITQ